MPDTHPVVDEQQTMTAPRAGEQADARDTVRHAAVATESTTDAESVARLLDLLTIDELRDRVRELYEAQRAVESEREELQRAREAIEAQQRMVIAEHETALRRSEQRLRAIFDTEPDCVKVMTPEGALLEINNAGVGMFESDSVEQLKGCRLDALICPEYVQAFGEMHARVMQGEQGLIEFEIIGLQGTRKWLETNATSMHDADSGSTVVVSICRDITRQKRAIEALHRHRTILQNMSNASPLGLLVVDDRTHEVLHFNPRFCELFRIEHLAGELTRGALSSTELMAACATVLVDAPSVAASCAILSDPANREAWEDEIACTDNRMIRRFSTQIRDERDQYFGRFYLFEDITARRQVDQERARLEGDLHQAMKMQSIGRLAGGVAHDFNNMLGVILGHTQIAMKSVRATDPIHIDLTAIHQAAERSAGLTRQLLAFASKQTAAPQTLDLNEVVGRSFQLLQRLISEDILLSWRPSTSLWPIHIDPTQFGQILTNLCVNARDAIEGVGTITIETANCTVRPADCRGNPDARPGDFVRLSVRDDGCGMDPDIAGQIFEPFFTTKQLGVGTGLGLATVYGTVKQNNGFIAVRTARDEGTTFEIYLPRYSVTEADVAVEESSTASPVGRETVLVVEDEPAILFLVTHILTSQGYHVLRANSPQAAIDMAAAHPGGIGLLLTDVIMPEMNGRDLAAALQETHPGMRALFMSGYTSDVIAKHGVLEDGVSFLQKPFSIDILAAKVREVLDAPT